MIALAGALSAQPRYDLLLKGGHVIDARNGISAKRDVAIAGGKIADVAADIPADSALRTVDVSGLYVTPGLVDIHVHVYAGTGVARAYAGDFSVYPGRSHVPNGVTTVVDAGSSGWRNFPDFKDRVIDRAKTRVLAMLNIVGSGMGGRESGAERQRNGSEGDSQVAPSSSRTSWWASRPRTTRARNGSRWTARLKPAPAANIPVMVDFGTFRPERPFQELVIKSCGPAISTRTCTCPPSPCSTTTAR